MFSYGAWVTKGKKKFKWLHIFFRVAQVITFMVLAVELVALYAGGWAVMKLHMALEWGMLETMWVEKIGPLWSMRAALVTAGTLFLWAWGNSMYGESKKEIEKYD